MQAVSLSNKSGVWLFVRIVSSDGQPLWGFNFLDFEQFPLIEKSPACVRKHVYIEAKHETRWDEEEGKNRQ